MQIETKRLILKALEDDDVSHVEKMLSDTIMMKFLFSGGIQEQSKKELFIKEHFYFGEEKFGMGIVIEKATKKFIGFGGILPFEFNGIRSFEIGFALNSQVWNKGFATEIGEGQIIYAFEYLGVEELFATVEPRNTASINVLEKLKMQYLKTIQIDERGERKIYGIKRVL